MSHPDSEWQYLLGVAVTKAVVQHESASVPSQNFFFCLKLRWVTLSHFHWIALKVWFLESHTRNSEIMSSALLKIIAIRLLLLKYSVLGL